MGHLSDDMARLHEEIITSRNERNLFIKDTENFISNLKNDVSKTMAGFHNAHKRMSKTARNSRLRCLNNLKRTVAVLKTDFHNAHEEMNKATRENRMAFISNIKQTASDLKKGTADLRREFADDIAGAHRAWLGKIG